MTAAVRALLVPVYWLAIAVLEFTLAPWLLLDGLALPWWWAVPAALAAGAAAGCVAATLQGPILDPLAARIAVRIEDLAVEWREITAATKLPPSGGTPTGGQTRPQPGRITP